MMGVRRRDLVRTDCLQVLDCGRAEALAAMRDARLVVVGGTGFVGTWIAELAACLNDEHGFGVHVTLISRHSERLRDSAAHLCGRDDVSSLEMDVRDIIGIPACEYLINASGTPDNRVHVSDSIGTIDIITRGTAALLEASYSMESLGRMLQVSSGLIYGPQPLESPALSETWVGGPECDSVVAAYPEAKRCAEALCAAWRSQYKLPIVTARPFAFIGPYQGLDKPWAVNNFLRDALAGGPIRILGDGDAVRSYMYGSDMAYWLLRMVAAGVPGQAYNVGSPHGLALAALARLISENVEPRPQVHSRTGGQREPSRFVPDVTKASTTLGLGITVPLEDALRRTLTWHRGG
jgi:nucleoside-diphosphate-sugar epimerase